MSTDMGKGFTIFVLCLGEPLLPYREERGLPGYFVNIGTLLACMNGTFSDICDLGKE